MTRTAEHEVSTSISLGLVVELEPLAVILIGKINLGAPLPIQTVGNCGNNKSVLILDI